MTDRRKETTHVDLQLCSNSLEPFTLALGNLWKGSWHIHARSSNTPSFLQNVPSSSIRSGIFTDPEYLNKSQMKLIVSHFCLIRSDPVDHS
jgi:hypothetical protein